MKVIRKYFMPGVLVLCVLLVSFWQVMSSLSRRQNKSFELTPEKLATFHPSLEGWTVRTLPIIENGVDDANIAAYGLVRDAPQTINHQPSTSSLPSSSARFLVRLVHGYNMPMCMKMKYYTVEKIQDNRIRPVSDPKLQSAFRPSPQQLNNLTTQQLSSPELPVQLWRLTSSVGDVSIWATTMIRADEFSPTSEDICSMAFPRVDIPDDPNWVPRGLGMDDLKHPVASLTRWCRGRWDASRWDLLTFLRLRRPVRTSEELLSYVTRVEYLSGNEAKGTDIRDLLEVHVAMLKELQTWRNGTRNPGKKH